MLYFYGFALWPYRLRNGIESIVFGVYNQDNIRSILINRLEDLHVFEDKNYKFAAMQSTNTGGGDLRRALKICQR
jgi:Cdc6-like AAA superfamily ATPase